MTEILGPSDMDTTEYNDAEISNNRPSKPKIAIMGEFSAGKSTLCNLLIGSAPLPVKVTATQLPPVWISYGTQPAYREDLEGNQIPIEVDQIGDVPLAETAFVRIFLEADILELCDLIDMPGISDPNMSSEVWENVIHHADGVLWCTHATQAWRQSEAAVWKSLPTSLYENSLLLITRIDKLLTERDRRRVGKRVLSETEGMFFDRFPLSLTRALEAADDRDKWISSGAERFSQSLIELIHRLADQDEDTHQPQVRLAPKINDDNSASVFQLEVSALPEPENVNTVVPLRVKPTRAKSSHHIRPERPRSRAM